MKIHVLTTALAVVITVCPITSSALLYWIRVLVSHLRLKAKLKTLLT